MRLLEQVQIQIAPIRLFLKPPKHLRKDVGWVDFAPETPTDLLFFPAFPCVMMQNREVSHGYQADSPIDQYATDDLAKTSPYKAQYLSTSKTNLSQ